MTMRFRGVRAILFDLDGTLVDTAPDIAAAVHATLRELERPTVSTRCTSTSTPRPM